MNVTPLNPVSQETDPTPWQRFTNWIGHFLWFRFSRSVWHREKLPLIKGRHGAMLVVYAERGIVYFPDEFAHPSVEPAWRQAVIGSVLSAGFKLCILPPPGSPAPTPEGLQKIRL